MNTSISLYSGREFNYLKPECSEFTIVDIAMALSRQLRFAAQSRDEVTISDHSVMVYRMVCERTEDTIVRFAALLHDASEFVTGDIPAPMKPLIPGFKDLENRIQAEILRRLSAHHLNYYMTEREAEQLIKNPLIKEADKMALTVERVLCCVESAHWPVTGIEKDLAYKYVRYLFKPVPRIQFQMHRNTTENRFMLSFYEAVADFQRQHGVKTQ